MTTLEQILKLLNHYQLYGIFQTNKKKNLRSIFYPNSIPKELSNYGIYIFTYINDKTNKEEIVYIGKNGTVNNKGTFGTHTLNKRIMQGKLKSKWIEAENYKVYWFITIKKSESEIIPNNIPSVVECDLLKKYFELEKKLPKNNNTF